MRQSLATLVTETHVEEFNRDGVTCIRGAVDEVLRESITAAVEDALGISENYFRRLRAWEREPALADYCLRSVVPRIAARLLDSDKLNLFYDQIFVKEPGSGVATPWHNDQPYWPVRGWPVMTAWLGLDPITAENGALEFIAGSHRWDRWFQPFVAATDGGNAHDYPGAEAHFEPLPDFDAERERHHVICHDTQPGDLLAFHALVVHGARANVSGTERRRGYAVRYAGRGATYHDGPTGNPRLVNPELRSGDSLDSSQYPLAELVEVAHAER